MEISLFSILILGFVLGVKHAIEPDHIIAVSTIASHSKKLWRSSLAGVFWGVGHTLTLFIVSMLIIAFKFEIPEKWALSFEFLVGIMLVYLGLTSFLSFKKKKIHVHHHEHGGLQHNHFHDKQSCPDHQHRDISYLKSMFIGIIHGLAGSAAMVILTMSTVQSIGQVVLYLLVFGLGTLTGMLLFTTIIGAPFVFTANSKSKLNQVLTQVAGGISIVFGFYYMYNLGFTEGLFQMWFK